MPITSPTFTDTVLGLTYSQDNGQVATARRALDNVAATAMTADESLALIRSLARRQSQ